MPMFQIYHFVLLEGLNPVPHDLLILRYKLFDSSSPSFLFKKIETLSLLANQNVISLTDHLSQFQGVGFNIGHQAMSLVQRSIILLMVMAMVHAPNACVQGLGLDWQVGPPLAMWGLKSWAATKTF